MALNRVLLPEAFRPASTVHPGPAPFDDKSKSTVRDREKPRTPSMTTRVTYNFSSLGSDCQKPR